MELSIEEKAQRYDETINKLRRFMEQGVEPLITRADIQDFFPELKDNEDERIRKWIRKELESKYVVDNIVNNEMADKAFAWIEKQGDHANFLSKIQVGDKVTRNKAGVLVNLSQLNRVAKKQGEQDEFTKKELECVRGYRKRAIKRLEELKEQSVEQILANSAKPCEDEQETPDKVEPKFKVGDMVVTSMNSIVQIKAVNDSHYTIDDGTGFSISYADEYWHLWTVRDAKDGDVLYSPKGIGVEGIFLIKGWKQVEYTGKTLCSSIAYRVEEDKIVVGGLGVIWWDGVFDPFYPATKEQRDLLFQKMKEAGYELDAEKKELRKIRKKPCMIQWKGNNLKEVIDFTGKSKNFDKWFKSFEEYEKYVNDHDGIFKMFYEDGSHYEVPVGAWIVKTPDGYNVASKAIFIQKPAWSEEDEQYLLVCKNALAKYQTTDKWDACIISHWLENKLKG